MIEAAEAPSIERVSANPGAGASELAAGVARLRIAGPLTFGTVLSLRRRATPLLEQAAARATEVELDLSGVTRTDSAGLALLVHWMRELGTRGAGRSGVPVRLLEVPEQLRAIARTTRLEQLLEPTSQPEPASEAAGT